LRFIGAEMRKINPQFRWHLTRSDKMKIRRLTLKGIRQSTIARTLHIGRDTISKWQMRMGLPTRLVIPEAKIMELFRKGWGGYRIAKHLSVAVSQVYKTAHKNGFRRTDGVGFPEPHGDVAGFIEALKQRQGYIKNLRKKYGVGACQANKLAHNVLRTIQFRPGASKPPLSSTFPQRHHDRTLTH